jgi:hypothetical protein
MCFVFLFVVFNTYTCILCRSLIFVKVEKMARPAENKAKARKVIREFREFHDKSEINEREFYEQIYNPVHAVLSQIGDLEEDEMQRMIQQKKPSSAKFLAASLAGYAVFKLGATFLLDKLPWSYPFMYDKVVISSKFPKSFTMFSKSLMSFYTNSN